MNEERLLHKAMAKVATSFHLGTYRVQILCPLSATGLCESFLTGRLNLNRAMSEYRSRTALASAAVARRSDTPTSFRA